MATYSGDRSSDGDDGDGFMTGLEAAAPEIDWSSLTKDPSSERRDAVLKEQNDLRFAQVMDGLGEATKAFRRQQTQSLMELDGAWHAFHLAVGPNHELSPKLLARQPAQEVKEDAEGESRMGRSYGLSTLTLNVSTHGPHHKRYSIM